MAAELVQKSDTPHTAVHDIESLIWVLLWICLKYMNSTFDIGKSGVVGSVEDTLPSRGGHVDQESTYSHRQEVYREI